MYSSTTAHESVQPAKQTTLKSSSVKRVDLGSENFGLESMPEPSGTVSGVEVLRYFYYHTLDSNASQLFF